MPSGRWTALVAAYISVAPTWKFHTVAFPVKNCTQASKFPVKNSQKLRIIGKKWE